MRLPASELEAARERATASCASTRTSPTARSARPSPGFIGAPALWGPTLSSAGNGVKIGIIDDGLDKTHPYFSARGYRMPPGFPKGQKSFTSAKVIVARAFRPAHAEVEVRQAGRSTRSTPSHATHVAGIAAGNHRTQGSGGRISGVAPKAYIGNYKVLTVPSRLRAERELGRDRRRDRGRRPRRDGRDQPLARRGGDRAEPRHRRRGARRSGRRGGRAGRRCRQQLRGARRGSITSPGSVDRAITVAAESEAGRRARSRRSRPGGPPRTRCA